MWDRSSIANEVYLRLNKSSLTPGFYTTDRVYSGIQQALDFVAVEMMIADQGWLKKIDFFDVEPNQIKIQIPPHIEMVSKISYLVGNVYTPLFYDSRFDVPQWGLQSGATQLPNTYSIVDNAFYFNPPLGVGGTAFLQVEYMSYPNMLRNDAQQVDPQFGRALIYYTIYKAASICAADIGSDVPAWKEQENEWYSKMLLIVNKRNQQAIPIGDFSGY